MVAIPIKKKTKILDCTKLTVSGQVFLYTKPMWQTDRACVAIGLIIATLGKIYKIERILKVNLFG